MTQEVLVLGGGATGLGIATELAERGQDVTLIDDAATASQERRAGVTARAAGVETAESAAGRTAATVVVATSCDARNLMLGTKAPRLFDAERVLALVNDPERHEAFEAADIEPICVPGALTRATTDTVGLEDLSPANPSADSTAGNAPTDPTERRGLGG